MDPIGYRWIDPIGFAGEPRTKRPLFCSMASMLRMAREDLKEIRGCNTDSCNYNGGGTENLPKSHPGKTNDFVYLYMYICKKHIYI